MRRFQMASSKTYDLNFSTTRLLTQDKPEIISKPEEKFETLLFLPEGEGRRGEGGLRTQGYFKKSYDGKPLVSVITVVYNGEKYLEETIQSVIHQTYDNVEYIIIDGGSIDGTLEIIKKYEDRIDYWVSEKDSGIYDAMNKGLVITLGEWLNFLNGADTFYVSTLLADVFNGKSTEKYDLIYGDFHIVGKDDKPIRVLKADELNKKSVQKGMIINHQSIFTKKVKTPFYNVQYRYKAEWNWLIDLLYKNDVQNLYYTNFPIVYYKLGGYSAQWFENDFKEYLQIKYKRFGVGSILRDFFYITRVWAGFKIRKFLNVDTLRIHIGRK